MPAPDDLTEIDGFASVLAVRRAKKRADRQPGGKAASETPPQQSAPKLGWPVTASGALIGRIARSIVPVKYDVVCYECDYTFPMSGQLQETICPKCRTRLKGGDYVIDKEWFDPVRTLGTVDIVAGGVLRGAYIVARDIVLAGSAEHGSLRACRRLELLHGARFDTSKMKTKDLVISAGASFLFPQPVTCRNLEVEGELNAIIFADGLVIVRTGGVLLGEIDCPHLVVEEGGGLEAQVCAGARSSKPASTTSGGFLRHNRIGLPGRN